MCGSEWRTAIGSIRIATKPVPTTASRWRAPSSLPTCSAAARRPATTTGGYWACGPRPTLDRICRHQGIFGMRIDFDHVKRSDGKFAWPNGARLAVVLSCEYEPVYQLKPLAGGQPNYRQLSEIRYEATRGLWRVLD